MRIAIVNDLMMAVEALRRVLARVPQHSLAWIARNGAEAVECSARDCPDLILMDLVMPLMDGVEATRRIMGASPCAILIVTATVDGNSDRVFAALSAGALDAVKTPMLGVDGIGIGASALLAKIEMLAQIIAGVAPVSIVGMRNVPTPVPTTPARPHRSFLVAIGSSAGGPAALAEVLRQLPKNYLGAVVVVQHLDEQFAEGLAEWLGQQVALPVRIANENEAATPGTVLIAGRGKHLVINAKRLLSYTALPANVSYRPSVDVFFQSVAEHWPDDALGVILTGMGRDGALGMKKMRDAGFTTIAQDKASCAVYGMPKAAAELGAASRVLPLAQIGPALCRFVPSLSSGLPP